MTYVFEAYLKELLDFLWFSGNSHPELVGFTLGERFVKLNVKGCRIDFSVTKRAHVVSSFDYENDPEIVREAERFLKKHAEMVPKLDEDGVYVVSWPSEALKYLGKWYKPKDRTQPSFFIVRK